MPRIELNLLDHQPNPEFHRRPRQPRAKKIVVMTVILGIILLAVFSSSFAFSDDGLLANLSQFDFFGQIGKLVTSGSRKLAGENNDRINILVIGMGGKNHEGGTLADTIILGSLQPSTKQIAMLSIPRDLSAPVDNYNWMKINAVHAYAEKKQAGSGGQAMAQLLGKLLGTEIDYYAVVDFDGFERLIDEFGGVDIEVENDLVDYQYPIRGKENIYPIENRFEILKIKKGLQHMDGDLALKYVRSRHGLGVEGSDFARSRRQQKIIAALKEKIFSLNTFLSPKRINGLLSTYNEHLNTNLEVWQLLKLAQLAKESNLTQIINRTIDDGPGGLLYSQIVEGAYVLIPVGNNFDNIKNLWQNIFTLGNGPLKIKGGYTYLDNATTATSTTKATATTTDAEATTTEEIIDDESPTVANDDGWADEEAAIEIQNGTFVAGWAAREKNILEDKGLAVIKIGNAPTRDYQTTIIYDLTKGKYPLTLAELKKVYGQNVKTVLSTTLKSTADILIVLGQ